MAKIAILITDISIHAPSRERLLDAYHRFDNYEISIHAPSRERLTAKWSVDALSRFQSTLPRGSDQDKTILYKALYNFNPRSLAGATS